MARLNWGPPAMMMRGTRLASGYVALPPKRRLPVGEFDRPEWGSRALMGAFRVAGVEWAYGRRVPDPLPRARLTAEAQVISHLPRQLARLDLRRIALVDPGAHATLRLGGGEVGRAELLRDNPSEIDIRTDSATRQLLVLSESHHPGWVASVDGQPCAIVRAYGDFMGCVVDPGKHSVAFRFSPTSVVYGTRLSIAAILATLGVLIVGLRKRVSRES